MEAWFRGRSPSGLSPDPDTGIGSRRSAFPLEGYILRFTRVPFGVSSSPFLLNATIRHHLHTWPTSLETEVLHDLCDNFYVDDFVNGANSTEGAVQKIITASTVMKAAGMDLRNWISNSTEITEMLRERNGHIGHR